MCFLEINFCILVVSLARNLQWGKGYFGGLGRSSQLPEAIRGQWSKAPCIRKLVGRGQLPEARVLGTETTALGDFATFSQLKLLNL